MIFALEIEEGDKGNRIIGEVNCRKAKQQLQYFQECILAVQGRAAFGEELWRKVAERSKLGGLVLDNAGFLKRKASFAQILAGEFPRKGGELALQGG